MIAFIGKEIADLWPLLAVVAAAVLGVLGFRSYNRSQRKLGRGEAEGESHEEREAAQDRMADERGDPVGGDDVLEEARRRLR